MAFVLGRNVRWKSGAVLALLWQDHSLAFTTFALQFVDAHGQQNGRDVAEKVLLAVSELEDVASVEKTFPPMDAHCDMNLCSIVFKVRARGIAVRNSGSLLKGWKRKLTPILVRIALET